MAGPGQGESGGGRVCVAKHKVCLYTRIVISNTLEERRGRGEEMASKKAREKSEAFETTEKVMQTFRIPRELVGRLRAEADRKGLDLTALRHPGHGRAFIGDFGLPEAARGILDDDRAALGMDREAYLLHLLFQRSLAVREEGPGSTARGPGRRGADAGRDHRVAPLRLGHDVGLGDRCPPGAGLLAGTRYEHLRARRGGRRERGLLRVPSTSGSGTPGRCCRAADLQARPGLVRVVLRATAGGRSGPPAAATARRPSGSPASGSSTPPIRITRPREPRR